MTNRRAKAVATATVLGLGALGGVALGSNPGNPGVVHQGGAGATASVTTGASGAAASASGQAVATKQRDRCPGADRHPRQRRRSGAARRLRRKDFQATLSNPLARRLVERVEGCEDLQKA